MSAPRLPSPSTGKKDYTLVVFLLISMALHGAAVYVGAYFTPPPPPPIDSTLDIEIQGDEKEPPPLGTNDAETGPPPEAEPEPTPPPVPEDTPPPPVVQNDFEVPEEAATPTPAPKPKATPRPSSTPSTKPAGTPAYNPNARPGAIKGVDAAHGGVAGGTGAVKSGGGKADFISRPDFKVPYALRQRLQGAKLGASAVVYYSGGSVTSVEFSNSSGNSSLDAAIKRHVLSNWRVKPGSTGKANLPIAIRL